MLAPGWQEISSGNRKTEVTNELRFEPTLVSSAFGGSLKIQVRKKGAQNSLQTIPFFSLPLSTSFYTIEEALEGFSAAATIHGLRHNQVSRRIRSLFRRLMLGL